MKSSQIKYISILFMLFRPNAVITDAYDVTQSGMYYVVAAVY